MATRPTLDAHPQYQRLTELLAEVPNLEERLLLAEALLLDCQIEALDRPDLPLKCTDNERQMAVAQQVLSALRAVKHEEEAMRRKLARADKDRYRRVLRDSKQSTDKDQKLPWLD